MSINNRLRKLWWRIRSPFIKRYEISCFSKNGKEFFKINIPGDTLNLSNSEREPNDKHFLLIPIAINFSEEHKYIFSRTQKITILINPAKFLMNYCRDEIRNAIEQEYPLDPDVFKAAVGWKLFNE